MSNSQEISITIPSKARADRSKPYLKYDEFIDYCNANRVNMNQKGIEAFEKKGLLFPCFRILYPHEMVKRKYKADIGPDRQYSVRNKWMPLLKLKEAMGNATFFLNKEFAEAIERGHPLEQAVKMGNPFVSEPKRKLKNWDKFEIVVDERNGKKIYEGKAEHYYSSWKIFFVDEINSLNTMVINRAANTKSGWAIVDKRIFPSTLIEFIPLFRIAFSFSYRRSLLENKYFHEEQRFNSNVNWDDVNEQIRSITLSLYSPDSYNNWIRFLRKLVELHEEYRGNERYLLSLEIKAVIAKTLGLLHFASDKDFKKICDDVSGISKNTRSRVMEEGILLFSGVLEKMFPEKDWDLERNAKDWLDHALKDFNSELNEDERLPEKISNQLFAELLSEPDGSALSAIRDIRLTWNNDDNIWQNDALWSGITKFAIAIEAHGKNWFGGDYLNEVFNACFNDHVNNYSKRLNLCSKKFSKSVVKATNAAECLERLEFLAANGFIPSDRRCGRHLIVTQLIRNFSAHQRGLPTSIFSKHFHFIYSSLMRTLFVIYAQYKQAVGRVEE